MGLRAQLDPGACRMPTGFTVSVPLHLSLSLLLFLCFFPLRALLHLLASLYGNCSCSSSQQLHVLSPILAPANLPGRRGSLALLLRPVIVRGVVLKGEAWVICSPPERGLCSAPTESPRPRLVIRRGESGCRFHSWGAQVPARQNDGPASRCRFLPRAPP